jgi:hypothetical protein
MDIFKQFSRWIPQSMSAASLSSATRSRVVCAKTVQTSTHLGAGFGKRTAVGTIVDTLAKTVCLSR